MRQLNKELFLKKFTAEFYFASLMGSDQEEVFFDKVVISHTEIVPGSLAVINMRSPLPKVAAISVQHTVTIHNAVKKGTGIPVLYDLVVFA